MGAITLHEKDEKEDNSVTNKWTNTVK